jgi:hypothetical protein
MIARSALLVIEQNQQRTLNRMNTLGQVIHPLEGYCLVKKENVKYNYTYSNILPRFLENFKYEATHDKVTLVNVAPTAIVTKLHSNFANQ